MDPALLARGQAEVAARIEAALADRAGYRELYFTLLMLGSHDLAVLRDAFGTARGVHHARALGPTHVLALLDLPGDLTATLEIAFGHQYEWWDEWIHVWSREAELRIEFPNPYLRHHAARVTTAASVDRRTVRAVTEPLPDTAFRQQWLHLLAVLDGEAEPRSTLRGGLEDIELAEAIIRALPPKPA